MEFAAVQPSSNLQIQIHAIMDRYHNAKSVTIPLPTRVRQTIGALLSDRKPGRNICFCEYIVSQLIYYFNQFPAFSKHFTLYSYAAVRFFVSVL